MPGKPKDDPNKTQQEEIADKKAECVRFYERNGVKQAAADWIGRSIRTVQQWEEEDEEFHAQMLRAKAQFYQSNRSKIRLDNLFANMYPDDFKPPTQTVDAKVTTIEGQSAEDLVAEAKRLGLDTTPYESLLTGTTDPRTPNQDTPEERA